MSTQHLAITDCAKHKTMRYPGHMDSTTMERERRYNYYIKYAQDALS